MHILNVHIMNYHARIDWLMIERWNLPTRPIFVPIDLASTFSGPPKMWETKSIFLSFRVLQFSALSSTQCWPSQVCCAHLSVSLQVLVPPRGFATFVTFILSQEGRGSNTLASLRPQKIAWQ